MSWMNGIKCAAWPNGALCILFLFYLISSDQIETHRNNEQRMMCDGIRSLLFFLSLSFSVSIAFDNPPILLSFPFCFSSMSEKWTSFQFGIQFSLLFLFAVSIPANFVPVVVGSLFICYTIQISNQWIADGIFFVHTQFYSSQYQFIRVWWELDVIFTITWVDWTQEK